MELKEFVAAIDLGTSKIVGIIGTKDVTGSLTIHALEKEDAEGCIKRGCIQNVDEAASKVKRLITKLENRAKTKIGKIYIGLGGQSVQSIDHKVTRQLNEDTPITDQIITSLKDVSMQMPLPGKEILEIVPSEYLVDGKKVVQPVGVYGSEIEATHKLIVGKQAIRKNLRRMEEKIQLEVAGYMLSPLAANLVLSEPEKSLGCVLVDFGAATTTVSVYKEGLLRHLAVLPLGGNTITRDIMSLQLLENVAEKLKIFYGNASPEIDDTDNKVLKQQNDGGVDSPEIQLRTLHQVILCRSEEIVENILNQVKISGYEKLIPAGFILTGGASNMKGLTALFRKKTDAEVKQGYFQRQIVSRNQPEIGKDASYSILLGMLAKGSVNCRKEPIAEPEPEVIIEQPVTPVEPAERATYKSDEQKTAANKGRSFIRFIGDMFKEDSNEQKLSD